MVAAKPVLTGVIRVVVRLRCLRVLYGLITAAAVRPKRILLAAAVRPARMMTAATNGIRCYVLIAAIIRPSVVWAAAARGIRDGVLTAVTVKAKKIAKCVVQRAVGLTSVTSIQTHNSILSFRGFEGNPSYSIIRRRIRKLCTAEPCDCQRVSKRRSLTTFGTSLSRTACAISSTDERAFILWYSSSFFVTVHSATRRMRRTAFLNFSAGETAA